MALLEILKYPARVLKTPAKEVPEVTDEIRRLLDDMTETMYAAPGVGLAAPQVGVSLRCIVVDTGKELPDGTVEPNLYQFVNPEIVSTEGKITWEEGCLSIPDLEVKTKRVTKLRLRGLDRNGKTVEVDAEGLFAVAIQQEMDHINGKLIIDYISPLKRELYLKEQKKKSK